MDNGLAFGWRTAVLVVAFVQLLLIATALARQTRNRPANRTLAALLVILAGMITPWMIGFAGFYDGGDGLALRPSPFRSPSRRSLIYIYTL